MSQTKSKIAYLLVITGCLLAGTSNAELPQQLGWYAMPNTRLSSVCAAENGFLQIWGASGCASITQDWNGGVFDTKRNRLIIWGGGHNGYYGNEVYAVNLDTQTIQRLTDPGFPIGPVDTCLEAIANNTQANSRHTYDGIEYIPGKDAMFVFGGSLACGLGAFGRDTWLFNFATNTWQKKNPSGPLPRAIPGILTAYDNISGLVYLYDDQHFYSYDVNADRFTQLSTVSRLVGYHLNATIDPVRRKFLIIGHDNIQGAGRVWSMDIAAGSNYQLTQLVTSGGDQLLNTQYPGVEYDPVTDRIVAWGDKSPNVVYSLNLDTRQWTSVTYTGGPTPVGNGTHGRWRYSPASNVFALANKVTDNVFIMRLTQQGTKKPVAPSSLAIQ
jgi:hypothetical protein